MNPEISRLAAPSCHSRERACEIIEKKVCMTFVRPSRRAHWALLRMRYVFDGIKIIPHPEEAAERPSRRTHAINPAECKPPHNARAPRFRGVTMTCCQAESHFAL